MIYPLCFLLSTYVLPHNAVSGQTTSLPLFILQVGLHGDFLYPRVVVPPKQSQVPFQVYSGKYLGSIDKAPPEGS